MIRRKTLTPAHVPLDPCTPFWQIQNGHMNPRRGRLKIGRFIEMNGPMLALDRVIGLTAVDPAAVHADAHAS